MMQVETTGQSRHSVLGIPAAALAALPLCPACYSAYAGILSALGLTAPAFSSPTVQTLLTLLFLSAALGALLYKAKSRRGYGPLALGIAAAVALSFAKFVMGSDPFIYAGVAMLVLAGVWNVWPRPDEACEIALNGAGPPQAES